MYLALPKDTWVPLKSKAVPGFFPALTPHPSRLWSHYFGSNTFSSTYQLRDLGQATYLPCAQFFHLHMGMY